MGTDAWGIVHSYEDLTGVVRTLEPETRAAILRAMGVERAARCPAPIAQTVIVRPGEQPSFFRRGTLILEDGTRLDIDGRLPPDLPFGYHRFESDETAASETPLVAAGLRSPTALTSQVICSPGLCPLPPARAWGWVVQLFALRSAESWGFGDLADLRRLGQWSAKLGADCLQLSPLCAVAPTAGQQPSPYSPTSRRFRNPLYLRIEEMPGAAYAFSGSQSGTDLETLVAAGRALNTEPRLDRDAVFVLKQQAFEQLWSRFSGDPQFDDFCREQGPALEQFAVYCVLAERYGGDWRSWPAEYQRPDHAAVARLADAERKRVRYHQWLQWQLDEQLARAASGTPLVQDLPIGFDCGGADAWAWQDVLATGCSVGAPPDMYNMSGQDWGLPPFIPHRLRACGYEPFIQTIRANLRHAGGLRIDHVMGLFRLFWIPHGMGPQQGAYVRYRYDELLAILALEAHRAGAYVVGEDLGTVECGVRETLAAHQVLSYRLLWFESEPIARYPALAMVAASTHDLPTIAGLWTGEDLRAARAAGLTPSAEATAEMRSRLAGAVGVADDAPVEAVIERVYAELAEAPSRIVTAMLDDAVASPLRINTPGTVDEWPNWSLALPGGLEAVEQSPLAERIATALDKRKR